jgi:hypothetical protein
MVVVLFVIAGLDPAIHKRLNLLRCNGMDAGSSPGHDALNGKNDA